MAAQYETITLGVSDLNRIKLPKFQRGFVWNSSKKNEFVQTLHDGFPFGALLVYPESEETGSKLLLLDGQQRLSTIKQYREDPLRFWKPINHEVYSAYLNRVNELLATVEDGPEPIGEAEFDKLVGRKTDLADWADNVAPNNKDIRRELRETVKGLQALIADYVNLDDLGILAIKFTGSKDHIADVFANLNKGGMPLSKYEIYSAAWVNTEIGLLSAGESPLQDEILELVKEYYTKMANGAEFDLNDFSEDELTINRTITLSEFATALGSFVQNRLGALIPESSSSSNEIGFGLLGIATGVDNRQLGTLNNELGVIRSSLQLILEKTDRISRNLQDIFSKLLKRIHASKSEEFETGISTTFKTLSYFAALWDLDPNSTEYHKSLRNIRSYYVFDTWTKVWSSHGDQRLLEYYPLYHKRSYLSPISKDAFKDAFRQWFADTTAPGINFSKETKALVTIHANLSYLSSTVPYGESFELEHIVAKKLINEFDDPQHRKVCGSSLGNCMYLPKEVNNKKKEKNLYEVNVNHRYDTLINESLYFTEDQFAEISQALAAHDYKTVNALIEERGRRVAECLIDLLLKD